MTHIGAKPSEDGGGKWEAKARAIEGDAVSYTHLTLPTILLV